MICDTEATGNIFIKHMAADSSLSISLHNNM